MENNMCNIPGACVRSQSNFKDLSNIRGRVPLPVTRIPGCTLSVCPADGDVPQLIPQNPKIKICSCPGKNALIILNPKKELVKSS